MRRSSLIIGTALLAAAATVGWQGTAFRRDVRGHEERVAHGSRLLQTACGPVGVGEAGQPGGPPALVVHGSGGGFDQGLTLGSDYAQRGSRVIAPSRYSAAHVPGARFLGFHSGGHLLMGRQADVVGAVVDLLRGEGYRGR